MMRVTWNPFSDPSSLTAK